MFDTFEPLGPKFERRLISHTLQKKTGRSSLESTGEALAALTIDADQLRQDRGRDHPREFRLWPSTRDHGRTGSGR